MIVRFDSKELLALNNWSSTIYSIVTDNIFLVKVMVSAIYFEIKRYLNSVNVALYGYQLE